MGETRAIIGEYLSVLGARFATAPREMALVETGLLYGLGVAAALFLLLALVRRSAVAAVAFSLVALTGLAVAFMLGRLDFLPQGTLVLILALYACAALLFLASAVRLARDNTLVGLVILLAILTLVALGGASALGLYDGTRAVLTALLGVAAFAGLSVTFDLLRGDKGALRLLPGALLAALSPVGMALAGPTSTWIEAAAPAIMLALGTVLAGLAALSIPLAPREARPKARRPAGPTYAPSYTPSYTPGPVGASGFGDQPTLGEVSDAYAPAPLAEPAVQAPGPARYEPAPAERPAQDARPLGTPPIFQPAVLSEAERSPFAGVEAVAADPASSHWGGGMDDTVPPLQPMPDEYVWDAMATEPLRAGDDVLRLFDARDASQLQPEDLRGALAPESLGVFDEEVLGGGAPRTGRFRVPLRLLGGRSVLFDGDRQVDEEGILSRLAGRFEEQADGAVRATPPQRSTERAPGQAMGRAPGATSPLVADAGRGTGQGEAAARALDGGEIAAHFQPIVRLSDRQTVGFEALARWQRTGTTLEADAFVPDLVAAGRGLDLAQMMVDQAARELSDWLKAQPGQGQFVSVNVSATDLPRKGLSQIVADAVAAYDLPPGALVVELGEGRIKASAAAALQAAKALRSAGASLAVDDFGTGHANLARLAKFRFDMVKTDRSLVAPLDKKSRQVIASAVAAARKAGVPVVAEGIEDEETARALTEIGCDFGQGFLFGRPEPAQGPAQSVGSASMGPGPEAAVGGLR